MRSKHAAAILFERGIWSITRDAASRGIQFPRVEGWENMRYRRRLGMHKKEGQSGTRQNTNNINFLSSTRIFEGISLITCWMSYTHADFIDLTARLTGAEQTLRPLPSTSLPFPP